MSSSFLSSVLSSPQPTTLSSKQRQRKTKNDLYNMFFIYSLPFRRYTAKNVVVCMGVLNSVGNFFYNAIDESVDLLIGGKDNQTDEYNNCHTNYRH